MALPSIKIQDRIRLHGEYRYDELLRDLRQLIDEANAALSQLVEWSGESFAPAVHDHDARYYTRAEIDLAYAALMPKAGGRFTGKILPAHLTAGGIATAAYSPAFEISSDPGIDTYVTFHRHGEMAINFGLKTDNEFYLGGASLGALAHKIWHAGNDGVGSGLDADKVQGLDTTFSATPNTMVKRDVQGDIWARIFRPTFPTVTTAATHVFGAHTIGDTSDNYMRPITIEQLALQIRQSAQMAHMRSDLAKDFYQMGIFRFYTRDSVANTKWHFKTNYGMNNHMVMFEIKGYEYGASKVIDAKHACYPYTAVNDVTNKSGQTGTHPMNSYRSADGFLCFSIDLTSTYFVGGIINVFEANPAAQPPTLQITADGYSSAAQAY